jgi:hypothetical protein
MFQNKKITKIFRVFQFFTVPPGINLHLRVILKDLTALDEYTVDSPWDNQYFPNLK